MNYKKLKMLRNKKKRYSETLKCYANDVYVRVMSKREKKIINILFVNI